MTPTHRRFAAFLAAILMAWPFAQLSAASCKAGGGAFTSNLVPPPECTSPIGICTIGTLGGRFERTYYFVMDTLVPSGNPDNPNEFVYTGHSVITQTHGGATILGQDTGVISIEPTGLAPFVTTVNIVGGTKQYAQASGEFVATGQLDFVTGAATGTFTSNVCK